MSFRARQSVMMDNPVKPDRKLSKRESGPAILILTLSLTVTLTLTLTQSLTIASLKVKTRRGLLDRLELGFITQSVHSRHSSTSRVSLVQVG